MSNDAILTIEDLDVKFRSMDTVVHAVKGNSIQLERGQTLAIVGESGSGKSVTARSVMRLLPGNAILGDEAKIDFDGMDVLKLSEPEIRAIRSVRVSMIFQEPMSSLNPVYTIGAQIAEVILVHQKVSKSEAMAQALKLLNDVQIPDPEDRLKQYPHQLSGGQRQRVMIAIALANNPDLLIADEPTTALDVTVQAEILALLKDLQKKYGLSVILITHDLTVVEKISDEVVVMRLGEVVERGKTADVFKDPQHPYTRALIASEPSGDPVPYTAGKPPLLSAKDVRVEFLLRKKGFFGGHERKLVAVNDISLDVHPGETVGIVGESGSGKTTFGKAMIRLISNHGGEIHYGDTRIDTLDKQGLKPIRRHMQMVFQDPFASLNPRMTVRQLVGEGLIINKVGTSEDRRERIATALVDAGLDASIMNRFPHEFSGGQRQRIAIARAIVMKPEFILLDEPTSALDLTVQAQIIDLLRKLQIEHGLSYVFISHDLKVVRALCHRILVMQHGSLVEEGITSEVMDNPKTDYMKRLIKAAFEVTA